MNTFTLSFRNLLKKYLLFVSMLTTTVLLNTFVEIVVHFYQDSLINALISMEVKLDLLHTMQTKSY